MLFGNAHVKEAVRELFMKPNEPRWSWHGGSDGNDAVVLLCEFDDGVGKRFGISGWY